MSKNLSRYKIKQNTNSKEVYCCKANSGTDSFIRGRWNRTYINYQIKMSTMFNISKATIRDIIAKRSWNNSIL